MISPAAFRRLATVTAVFAYLQITVGTTVRVSQSGLGCPDWPLCHGRFYPVLDVHSIIEFSHRALGTITGLLVIATVVAAWLTYRRARRHVAWLASLALLAIACEGLLGGLVVIRDLAPWLVLAHLGLAMTILGLLLTTALVALPAGQGTAEPGYRNLAIAAAALIFVVSVAGSAVVASHADEVCKSWPLCGGGFQPDFAGINAFNMAHRLLSAATGLLVLHVGTLPLRRPGWPAGLRIAGLATVALLLVQGFVLGPGVAITQDNAFWEGFHVAVATLVWAGALTLAVLAIRHTPRRTRAAGAMRLEEAAA